MRSLVVQKCQIMIMDMIIAGIGDHHIVIVMITILMDNKTDV